MDWSVRLFGGLGYILVIVFALNHETHAQAEWKLMTERNGIRVYSKEVLTSKIKAIQVRCTVDAPVSQVVALLLDLDAAPDWVSHTKSCRLIKHVSPSELYYYSEVAMPWPLENRDFVARVRVIQHPVTREVTVDAPAVGGHVTPKKGVVRITHSVGYWKLNSPDGRRTNIEYTLQVDPGGVIPAWLVNALAAQGPLESFKAMRTQLSSGRYAHVRLPFIQG